ncbi:MAG: alpha-ketoglutarate-dependent dioxygenase AlkB [Blastocatellia bacterium]|nr:alpha-ketoglutarate-dependent dioxygenase AlkB [Blastocatellia bacterium]
MNNFSPTQLGFDFSAREAGSPDLQVKKIPLPDADLQLFSGCFSAEEMILQRLLSEIRWQQDYLRFYGKEVAVPRLTAWYGDDGKEYTYSHITMKPHPWTELLLGIKGKAEALSGVEYNSVLLNLYRSGADGVSWHQDNEPELGDDPVIASVSFGATRIFQMKHLKRKDIPRVDIPLVDGSLLVMGASTQRFWRHRIPKTEKAVGARVNLTFRYIRV